MIEKYTPNAVSTEAIYYRADSLLRLHHMHGNDEPGAYSYGAIVSRQLSPGLYTARSTRGTLDVSFMDPEYTTRLIAFGDDTEAKAFLTCEINDESKDHLASELGAAATPGMRFWRRGAQQQELRDKLAAATEAFLNGEPTEVSEFPNYMITLDAQHRFLKEDELFDGLSDTEYGEALPRKFADTISHDEACRRLAEVTIWLDAELGATLQESYQKEEAFRGKLGQIPPRKKDIDPNDLGGLLTAHRAEDHLRAYGDSMSIFAPDDAKGLHHYRLADPNTLLLVLCRMQNRNPRDFMIDCYDDFSAFQVAYEHERSMSQTLDEAAERWTSLDKNQLLEPEIRNLLADHEAAQKQVRIKGLRLCYLGMLYDTFQPLPDRTIPQPLEYADGYQQYVAELTGVLVDGMPSGLVTLAGDLAGALANVPIDQTDDKMTRTIVALFQEKAPKMLTEVHVQALRQQLARVAGGYISLYADTPTA